MYISNTIIWDSVQLLSRVWLSNPMDCSSQSLFKLMSFELVMLPNHLVPCHSLLLLPSIFPSISVFSNESALHVRWPKNWSFSFSINTSIEYSELISFRKLISFRQSNEKYLPINYAVLITVMLNPLRKNKILSVSLTRNIS